MDIGILLLIVILLACCIAPMWMMRSRHRRDDNIDGEVPGRMSETGSDHPGKPGGPSVG